MDLSLYFLGLDVICYLGNICGYFSIDEFLGWRFFFVNVPFAEWKT